MARIRTVKPSYFVNVDLSECCAHARLLGIALLTMADRDGRLKDCPKAIKLAALPWDTVDVDALLTELTQAGFILRYTAEGARLIQVLQFSKHQVVSPREPQGTLPGPDQACTGHVSSTAQTVLEQCPIIPEQCSDLQEGKGREGERKGREQEGCRETASAVGARNDLPTKTYPLSAILDADAEPIALGEESQGAKDVAPAAPPRGAKPVGSSEVGERFAQFWAAYPKKNAKPVAMRVFASARITDDTLAVILADLATRRVSHDWTKDGGQYIPMASTYLNQRRWEDAGIDPGLAMVPAARGAPSGPEAIIGEWLMSRRAAGGEI
jgi:hypothetical protein